MGTLRSMLLRYFQSLRFLFRQSVELGQYVRISRSAVLRTDGGGIIRIGERSEVLDGVILQTSGGNIEIGCRCSINAYTIIYGHGGVRIGDNVLIAGHTMIIPNMHVFTDPHKPINKQGSTRQGITIEDDVWIAHGVSILDGVTVGRGCIVGAGAVVNKSIPPYSIAVGVPAKVIGSRNLE